jgi:hypothetical protein
MLVCTRIINCASGAEGAIEEELRSRVPNIASSSYVKVSNMIKFIKRFQSEWIWGNQADTVLYRKQHLTMTGKI